MDKEQVDFLVLSLGNVYACHDDDDAVLLLVTWGAWETATTQHDENVGINFWNSIFKSNLLNRAFFVADDGWWPLIHVI